MRVVNRAGFRGGELGSCPGTFTMALRKKLKNINININIKKYFLKLIIWNKNSV